MPDYEEDGRGEWVEEQFGKTKAVVEELFKLIDTAEDIHALPEDKDEARKIVAVEDAVRSSIDVHKMAPEELSKVQLHAAMLRGRGLVHEEIAEVLNLPGGAATVHTWESNEAAFRRAINYWRRVANEDQYAYAMREVDALAANVSPTENPGVFLKLIKLRLMLADKPEDRERWEAEIMLKAREVAAKEKAAGKPVEGVPPWVPSLGPAIVDADFTVANTDEGNGDADNTG